MSAVSIPLQLATRNPHALRVSPCRNIMGVCAGRVNPSHSIMTSGQVTTLAIFSYAYQHVTESGRGAMVYSA